MLKRMVARVDIQDRIDSSDSLLVNTQRVAIGAARTLNVESRRTEFRFSAICLDWSDRSTIQAEVTTMPVSPLLRTPGSPQGFTIGAW
jgi:hypothetical protein